MAKKKADDGAAEGGEAGGTAKKKPAGKKAAPVKKAPAKKPAAKKPPPRKKKDTAETPVEAVEAASDAAEVIDAEIVAETPASELEDAADETPPVELSDEEKELSSVYGEDLTSAPVAHGEFKDRQSADEDRPMMPEINAREERKQRWEERRDRRRSRREDRDRQRDERRANNPGGGGQPQQAQRPQHDQRPPQHHDQRPQGQGSFQNRPIEMPKINGDASDPLARVGTPLGDAAAAVFTQLRNGQPLPVRQLAAMMRKRNLVNQDPEQLWPQLKAELLGDERSYRTLGLRPRIVYRGRDLFAPGPVAMSVTSDAEAGVASALSKLASATHKALGTRLARASAQGFERIIHAYLVAAGFREIDWVKRVGGISYASATAPGISRTVLISARSGSEPIDRRGIGELRVGVEAKDLVAGILFSAGELSEDAERELERAGRSISVVCGDQLVAALIQAGVGVVSAAAPIHYVDDQLLEELLAG